MKKSELTFLEGFDPIGKGVVNRALGNPLRTFNWDKAAIIIREYFNLHPDLKAEAGLQGDWDYTGGVIFENGKPTNDEYTYLSSNWSIPTLILSWDGCEQKEIELYCDEDSRFYSSSKWDETSLSFLGINL